MTSIASLLLDTQAVNIRPQQPFTLTSGKQSPVYVDCRRLIGFVEERNTIIDQMVAKIKDLDIDIIAGGETAGIPYAALLAAKLNKPMVYIRKKPKGFGKNSQIEGYFEAGKNVLLVEDLAMDGGSKQVFIDALRKADLTVAHCIVVFHYGFAEETMQAMQVKLHALATWDDILQEAEQRNVPQLDVVRQFLNGFKQSRAANG